MCLEHMLQYGPLDGLKADLHYADAGDSLCDPGASADWTVEVFYLKEPEEFREYLRRC